MRTAILTIADLEQYTKREEDLESQLSFARESEDKLRKNLDDLRARADRDRRLADEGAAQLKGRVQELHLRHIELQEQLSGQASIMSASQLEFDSRERMLTTDLEGAYRQNALLVERVNALQARSSESAQSSLQLQQAVHY